MSGGGFLLNVSSPLTASEIFNNEPLYDGKQVPQVEPVPYDGEHDALAELRIGCIRPPS